MIRSLMILICLYVRVSGYFKNKVSHASYSLKTVTDLRPKYIPRNNDFSLLPLSFFLLKTYLRVRHTLTTQPYERKSQCVRRDLKHGDFCSRSAYCVAITSRSIFKMLLHRLTMLERNNAYRYYCDYSRYWVVIYYQRRTFLLCFKSVVLNFFFARGPLLSFIHLCGPTPHIV
jgi:hypothetical protein